MYICLYECAHVCRYVCTSVLICEYNSNKYFSMIPCITVAFSLMFCIKLYYSFIKDIAQNLILYGIFASVYIYKQYYMLCVFV